MNLYQKLQPAIREKLDEDVKKYPTLVGSLIETLKKKKFVIELTMGEVTDIKQYSPTYVSTIVEVWDMFDDINIKSKV
tara:strand:- start:6222 stop:6455 length:234 start_codon:yes stop_codon:yes gene_type:complete